jgi:hypothetical protein
MSRFIEQSIEFVQDELNTPVPPAEEYRTEAA